MVDTYKGLVLAAGYGTRLRPITAQLPKPLVPFAGTTPLLLALEQLKIAGCPQLAVNSHYKADHIQRYLGSDGPAASYHAFESYEAKIRGTGGALCHLDKWRGDDGLVVVNGDVVSTLNLGAMVAHHQRCGAAATMAVLPNVIPGERGVYVADGQVVGFGKAPPTGAKHRNFACAQVLSPLFLDLLPQDLEEFDVIKYGYMAALERGMTISAYSFDGYWHDLRNPPDYGKALLSWLRLPKGDDLGVRSLLAKQDRSFVDDSGCFYIDNFLYEAAGERHNSIFEGQVQLGKNCLVQDSILLDGAKVVDNEMCKDKLRGADYTLSLV